MTSLWALFLLKMFGIWETAASDNTIFQRSTAENCTRVNTKSEQGIDCEFRWMKGSTAGEWKVEK